MIVTINHRMVPLLSPPPHNNESQDTWLASARLFSGKDKWIFSSGATCCDSSRSTRPSPSSGTIGITLAGGLLEHPAATDQRHHSSTRFFRMISRTSAVTSSRMLSMGSSVRQKRTTLPSGFTRNFQKFHLGIFCTESETRPTKKKDVGECRKY